MTNNKYIEIDVPYSLFSSALLKLDNTVKDTFVINKNEFESTAVVKMKLLDKNIFKFSFQNLFPSRMMQRYYKGFEMICIVTESKDKQTTIKYKIQLKKIVMLALLFFILVMLLIAILKFSNNESINLYYFFVFLSIVTIFYNINKGKREMIKNAKLFLTMFPNLVDTAQISKPFSW